MILLVKYLNKFPMIKLNEMKITIPKHHHYLMNCKDKLYLNKCKNNNKHQKKEEQDLNPQKNKKLKNYHCQETETKASLQHSNKCKNKPTHKSHPKRKSLKNMILRRSRTKEPDRRRCLNKCKKNVSHNGKKTDLF